MIAEHIAPALRYLRRRRGRTQTAVAEAAGISANLISNWETGHTLPSWRSLTRVLEVFGADLVDLHFGIQAVSGGVEPAAEPTPLQCSSEAYLSPLGPALRFLRKRAGRTQQSVATAAGISKNLLSNWETEATFPTLGKLDKVLCGVLEADLLDLHNTLRLLHGKPVLRLRTAALGQSRPDPLPVEDIFELLARMPEVLRWLAQFQQLLSAPEALEDLSRRMKEGLRP